jgi:hypothetical protein
VRGALVPELHQRRRLPNANEPRPTEQFWDAFNLLHDDVVHLRAEWQLFEHLFVETQERVDLLNACAGTFFAVVYDLLLFNLPIGVARLMDHPTMLVLDQLRLERGSAPASATVLAGNPTISKLMAMMAIVNANSTSLTARPTPSPRVMLPAQR